jgi:ATP-binding cassette subfamily B protein
MSAKRTDFTPFGRELRLIGRRAWQVWRTVPRRHRLALGAAAFLMALASATAIAAPVLLGRLVDGVKRSLEQPPSQEALFRFAAEYLGAIALLVTLREGLHVLRRFLVENTCTRVEKHLSVKVISHLFQVDLATLTHEKVGALHGRIFRSIDGYMMLLSLSFIDFFPALLTGLFALGAALTKQPWVGLVMAGVIPASVFLTAWQVKSQKGVRLGLLRSREELDGTVIEQLGGLDYVRVAHTNAQEVKRVARAAERRRHKELRHHVAMSFFGAAKALTEGFFHLAVLALAVYLAVVGRISYGDIFTFSMLFTSIMTPLAEVHRVVDEGHEASLRVADLMDLLGLPLDPSFQTPTHRVPRLDDGAPIIEVADLRVEYPTAEGRRRAALDGASLTVHPGETVGIVGRSGCGKSTLLKVLMRLVHPCGGRVRLKGVPLEEVSREAISIQMMPDGYATAVAERGHNLSGGQRQRLALARVFLLDPPVLILDEATSALDTLSERSVQRAIDEARTDRTVILVAHRLSTLTDADRILVFDHGRVVEAGPYADLVKQGGIFAEMVFAAEKASPDPVEAGTPA